MGKRNKKNMPLSINWTMTDDRDLRDILQSEIKGLAKQISAAPNPSKRKKLRDRRKKYKEVLAKVNGGDYGSEQFFLNEENKGVYVNPNPEVTGAVSVYDDISFQYDTFFRKKRYYGFALPLISLLLMIALLFIPILGNVLPTSMQNDMGTESVHLFAMFTYKLDTKNDVRVPNDGNWPSGVWADNKFLERGEIFKTAAGGVPETVSLYAELGMRSIDITGFDMLKAFFYSDLRPNSGNPDFLEDIPFMNGKISYYYAQYMFQKTLTVTADPEGKYDVNQILRIVSTLVLVYGYFFALIALLISLVFTLFSMFSYTSRRIHILPIFVMIFNVLMFMLPAFLALDEVPLDDNHTIGELFSGFFSFSNDSFIYEESYRVMCGIFPIVSIAISALLVALPKIFKNKTAKYQTFVPKGNKPRKGTYDKQ